MRIFVTGGAGFIGSHLVDNLVKKDEVTIYDNLSSGNIESLKHHLDKPNVRFINGDLLDRKKLQKSISGHDFVYHLAANPDIRFGVTVKDTELDLNQGTMTTYNVLESMRIDGIKNIVFSSSSVVYGETKVFPTPENYGPLLPISLYGASKLASESLITAFSHTFNMKCWIFRFANIIGERQTHGIIFDFLNKLRENSDELKILGNGKQKKSYLLVDECIEGILFVVEKAQEDVNIEDVNVYNLGSTGQVEVSEIARIVTNEMGLKNVKFKYTGGKRGWLGDVTEMLLDVTRINNLGWKAKYGSREAICQATKEVLKSQ